MKEGIFTSLDDADRLAVYHLNFLPFQRVSKQQDREVRSSRWTHNPESVGSNPTPAIMIQYSRVYLNGLPKHKEKEESLWKEIKEIWRLICEKYRI